VISERKREYLAAKYNKPEKSNGTDGEDDATNAD
ncbi:unnamed protein product, partial [Allacma fusca]